MEPEPLVAVAFDFRGTLARDTPLTLARGRAMRLRALADVLARAGCPHPPDTVEAAYERCGAEMVARFRSHHRDVGIRNQLRLVFDCLGDGVFSRLAPELVDVVGIARALRRRVLLGRARGAEARPREAVAAPRPGPASGSRER